MEVVKLLYTLTLSTFIFIAIYLVSQNQRKLRKHNPLPPGPRPLPIIGHFHLLKSPLHKTLRTLSVKYGPVLGLKLGSQFTVVVSSPAAVEECFGKNDVVLANRPQLEAGKYIDYDHTTMGASNYGDHWRNVRRISNQEVFSVQKQSMFVSLRHDEVKSMIKSLFNLTRQETLIKVEMRPRITEVTFNIIVGIVTGKRYYGEGVEDSSEANEFKKMIRTIAELSGASNPADFFPFLKLINSRSIKKKLLNLQTRIDEVLQNLIDECKAKDGAVKSLLSNILPLQESDSVSISDKTIKGLMLNLINGGTDTGAVTIEWAMSLLLNNPKKLKKAQSELNTVIGPDRLVSEADLPNLIYLRAIINETLRMHPSLPLLVPHYSSAECTIQGFHIPRNTMVLVNAWGIHTDPEVWNEPLKFKPERFENVEESIVYKFMPFGNGRRSCPGAAMARKVVGLALASLLQCFEWERIGEGEVDMCEGDGLTMPKVTPLEVMCKPRMDMFEVLSNL